MLARIIDEEREFEVARSGREDFGVHGRRICWISRNGGDKARGSRLKDESY
ncbi:BnaC01g20090D [Brassica napus]|uniref:BnaC01g20090D protein n=1 Tax=Brassica napus TaxID=3708 RepID=A0A078HUP7_BRANA|nr:BnaC01g20090D [Brassica napus]